MLSASDAGRFRIDTVSPNSLTFEPLVDINHVGRATVFAALIGLIDCLTKR